VLAERAAFDLVEMSDSQGGAAEERSGKLRHAAAKLGASVPVIAPTGGALAHGARQEPSASPSPAS
jgi:hypothetical protein